MRLFNITNVTYGEGEERGFIISNLNAISASINSIISQVRLNIEAIKMNVAAIKIVTTKTNPITSVNSRGDIAYNGATIPSDIYVGHPYEYMFWKLHSSVKTDDGSSIECLGCYLVGTTDFKAQATDIVVLALGVTGQYVHYKKASVTIGTTYGIGTFTATVLA